MRRSLSVSLHSCIWLTMLTAIGCAPPSSKSEQVAEDRAALYLGDSNGPARTTTDAHTGPSAAVGSLSNGFGVNCSATAITRNVVLTARHCFCNKTPSNSTFSLPQPYNDVDGNPQPPFTSPIINAFIHPAPEFDTCLLKDIGDDAVIPDIELLLLADSIPVEALPELPQVDLGANIRQLAETFENHVYIQVGFGEIAPKSGVGIGTRREGYVGDQTLFYEDGSIGFNGLSGWYLDACGDSDNCAEIFGEEQSTMGHGDSGGGLFLQPLDGNNNPTGRPILIGVISSFATNLITSAVTQRWASTGDRLIWGGPTVLATTNASLIAQQLGPDLDEDGIFDNADNCAASTCKTNCANPDQIDSDGDFRGDACDSCPQIPDDGSDKDQDGIADVCDPCPLLPKGDMSDFDLDDVGAACDTCPGTANARPTCISNADCALLPNDSCIKPLGALVGNCALQGDDEDQDGFGLACDICPRNPMDSLFGLRANSNPDAEMLNFAAPEGDICEEVPIFIARPIVRPFGDLFDNCQIGGETEKCADSVQFFASSSLGSENGAFKKFPDANFKAPVGFRHCDCFDPLDGVPLNRADCIATQCRVRENSYSTPNSPYRRVTIRTNSVAFPVAGDVFPSNILDPTFPDRAFNNVVTFSDIFPHTFDELPDNDELEIGRLGPTETITWRWRKDLAQGHIQGFPAGAPIDTQKTVGIFETIVRPTVQGGHLVYASTNRDEAGPFPGELRRTHTYLTTPLAKEVPLANVPPIAVNPCASMPCTIILQPELPRINPDPTDDPFLIYRTPIDIFAQGGVIYGTTQSQTFDPSPMLSAEVEALLLEGTTQWLRPVERGVTLTQLQASTHFVALPNAWTPTSQILEVAYDDGVYELLNVHPFAANHPPAARTGARGLLSVARRSVFLVGGRAPGGHTTGEVWRYDLDTHQWSEDIFDAPRIEDVLALTYDSATERMLILHKVHPRNLPAHVYRAQLVTLDYRTHRAELVDEWPVANTFSRISLTARQNGSFVFLGAAPNGQHVKAYRFELNDGKTLKWTGTATIPGELLDEPAVTNAGLAAPMKQGGKHVMKMIYDADFVPPNKGWTKL